MFLVLSTFLCTVEAYAANETCGFEDMICDSDVDNCCDPLQCIAGHCEPYDLGLGDEDAV